MKAKISQLRSHAGIEEPGSLRAEGRSGCFASSEALSNGKVFPRFMKRRNVDARPLIPPHWPDFPFANSFQTLLRLPGDVQNWETHKKMLSPRSVTFSENVVPSI